MTKGKTPKAIEREARIAEQKQEIVARIAEGESLRAICREEGMPCMAYVMRWLSEDPEFAEHYTRARETWADAVFDELDDVSEQATQASTAVEVAGLRLKADNMKWKLARMNAKKYGDKVSTEVGGVNGAPIKVDVSLSPEQAYLKLIGK